MTFRLHIEFGGRCVKRGPFWIPDGLHIWIGSRGVHMFWSRSPYQRRITFDRLEDE